VLTNVTALELESLPKSITVLGAGPIGMEFAQVFNRLGSKVTVIEKFDQVLPKEEKELSDELEKILLEEGIEIHTCTEVTNVKREGGMKVLAASCPTGDKVISSKEILIAIGRSPNVEGLNLEAAGVKYDKRRGIPVDLTMRTNVKHIYACGDVAGPFPFTHMAEYQAGIVLANALFPLVRRKADYRVVPWVTYVDPELARVGLTELEANEKYGKTNVKVYRFKFSEVDRAVIEGEGHGIIKLVCDRKLRLLGAHILGPHAGELIHEYVLAMKLKAPITAISQTIHVYPTVSQAVKRACDQYYREKLFTGWFPKVAKWLIRLT
jgi:pyruvate/2-oxoglutarate dehydrogenase complex dihydrolipoamide dehydrogenase (E3) component